MVDDTAEGDLEPEIIAFQPITQAHEWNELL
jgi:hypothetical protein